MSATSIHATLRHNARRDPERLALIHGDTTINRGELDAWSDSVAGFLAEEGVRADSIVPLQFETAPALVAAALGVLKLGAAYAVMDPQWDARRLRRIDEVLGGAFAVHGPGRATSCFAREVELPTFDVSAPRSTWEPVRVEATDLATVFFTSGSTGEPKAVLSTHRATLRMFTEDGLAHINADTVMPHLGSSNWDAFPFEVWGPLLRGGVCVLRQQRALSPAELRHEISEHGVNSIFFTASLFNILVDEDVAAFGGLHFVFAGGEALSSAHAARFLAAHPDIPLFNAYGPAESTCLALTHRVTVGDTRGAIPLGRPVSRTGVHVLDGVRECGQDELGELCISGEGVSPGYLGDEESTSAKFVEVRIGDRPVRVYRTGDYGSRTSDGVFTFAGRRDRELKIRGHRIDAGKIERTAAASGNVAQCAALPLLGLSGQPESLALAVVSADADRFDEKGLRGVLETALPAGWVPETIVQLAALPLTGNGKLDMQALHSAVAKMTLARKDLDADDALVAAFSRVLGGIEVDPDASIFAQGGTSLAAVRLCTALSRLTGLSIPTSAVLGHPSVNDMRAWITDQLAAGSDRVQEAGIADSSPLTGMQSGLLFQHLDRKDTHNHAYLAWRIAGALDIDCFVAALQDVHRRHPYLHGRYAFLEKATWNRCERPLTVERVDAPDEETALSQLQVAFDRPFSLFEGDVWRAVLCELGEGGQWLFGISSHHIAFDGWSVRILVEDLAAAYHARCVGHEVRSAHLVADPLAIYAETERIRDLADLSAQRNYWVEELAGFPTGPAPWVSPAPLTDRGARNLDVPLSREQADLIARRAIGTGLLPLFIAALGAALAAAADAEDFTIGIPISQRSTPMLQDTIACLINTLCVRLRAATADDVTAQAEGAVLAALRNSDLSTAEVARITGLAGQQLFHVIGAVQDSPGADLRLDGCEVDPIEVPYINLRVPLLAELFADNGIASSVRVTYDAALVTETMAQDITAGILAELTDSGLCTSDLGKTTLGEPKPDGKSLIPGR